jgi:hypothetical protein
MKIKISPRVLVMAISVIISHTSTMLQATTIQDLIDVYNKCLKTKTQQECFSEYDKAMIDHGCPDVDHGGPGLSCKN